MQKSLALCLFLTTALPACTEGDRALQGKCPTGETCSDQTPHGLTFHGTSRSSVILDLDAIPPTAVGGTQTIELLDARTGSSAFGSWRAEPSGPVAIAGQAGNHVTVRGTGDGDAMLRIVAARDGKLLDRHAVTAATAARVGLLAMGEVHEHRSDLWFVGAKIEAAIAVESAAGDPLVDENLSVTVAAPSPARLERSAWDRISIQGAPVGPLALTISAGTLTAQRVALSVVDAIDTIDSGAMTVDRAEVGQSFMYCFEGRRGGAAVNGLTWTYGVEGAAAQPTSSLFNGCAVFQATAVGRATVTAKAAGLTATRTIDVTPAKPPTTTAHAASLRAAQMDDGAAPADSDDEAAGDGAVDATLGERALLD